MFTRKQVIKINRYYILPLFLAASNYIGIDEDEDLTNGHCYYFAERLAKFLQGKWRNVGTEYLTKEEMEKRNSEIGRVCCVNSDHYFVNYNGDFYDGEGLMAQTDNLIWLWKYMNPNTGEKLPADRDAKIFSKNDLYYLGDNPSFDVAANSTMSYYKSALWEIYDLIFEPFADELITKLEKEAEKQNALDEKDRTDVGIEAILTIYRNKSKDLLENDPGTRLKVQDIVKKVSIKDEEEEEKRKTSKPITKEERVAKKWGDLTQEEYIELMNSDEFRKKYPFL
ncbi:MAG: hypothetical protein IKP98_00770 [Bacilli bacterium]|nr:hypothetical protein [Bacilli bacterium]